MVLFYSVCIYIIFKIHYREEGLFRYHLKGPNVELMKSFLTDFKGGLG